MGALRYAFMILTIAGAATAAEYRIESGGEGNEVRFLSKAPMETVEGRTDQVRGHVRADLHDLAASLQVEVRVDLASLDTGIGLRNRHMRENHLETELYPEAVFRAGEIREAPASVAPGGEASFVIVGHMELHGVTRELAARVTLRRGEADGRDYLDVETAFDIHLDDYEIERPKFLMLKLDKKQQVSVRLRAWETE